MLTRLGRLKTLFSGIIFCPLSGPEKIYKTACSGQTALMKLPPGHGVSRADVYFVFAAVPESGQRNLLDLDGL